MSRSKQQISYIKKVYSVAKSYIRTYKIQFIIHRNTENDFELKEVSPPFPLIRETRNSEDQELQK